MKKRRIIDKVQKKFILSATFERESVFFIIIIMGIRAILHIPRLILRVLKLTIM